MIRPKIGISGKALNKQKLYKYKFWYQMAETIQQFLW